MIRLLIAASVSLATSQLLAGGLVLNYGLRLTGEPLRRSAIRVSQAKRSTDTVFYPLMTVEDGVRRYHFSAKLVDRDSVDEGFDISGQSFEFSRRQIISGNEPTAIGYIDQSVPFSERSGRELQATTEQGPVLIRQNAVLLQPDYVEVESVNLNWNYGLLTTELSDESLLALLDTATNPSALPDVLARVSFLTQAKRYKLARSEMERLESQFPEAADRARQFRENLFKLYGRKAIREVRALRSAGQHRAALTYAQALQDSEYVSLDTADEAADVVDAYNALSRTRDEVEFQLGAFEGRLDDTEAKLVRPLRSALLEEIHADNIDRLKTFLASINDVSLTPSQKLALAYSAWVAGPSNATDDLVDAADYWTLRAAVQDYVRADNRYVRDARWPAIDSIEGVSIETLQAVIERLPPVSPNVTQDAMPMSEDGSATLVTPSGVKFDLALPPEYSPSRDYPVLIVLHTEGMSAKTELTWWAGTAERRDLASRQGYLVAAPHRDDSQEATKASESERVFDVLRTLRRRFGVDSDRVFLAGHGTGADAVLDIGFARPLPWAGLIPIGGRCSPAVKSAWENGAFVSTYAVNGSLDGRTFANNSKTLQRLMEAKADLVLVEYVDRGDEPFGAEKPRIFEWMALHQRPELPRDFDATVFSASDTDWMWYRARPEAGLRSPDSTSRLRGQTLQIKITPSGNKVYMRAHPATVYFSPELIDFEQRVRFRYGSRTLKSQILEPSMRTMLDDFSERFDRQRLFWASLNLPE